MFAAKGRLVSPRDKASSEGRRPPAWAAGADFSLSAPGKLIDEPLLLSAHCLQFSSVTKPRVTVF